MKKIIMVAVLTFFVATSASKGGWFTDHAEEELNKIEEKLQNAEQSKSNWEGIAFILGIGCVVTLVAGTAIGSRGRRNAKRD